MRKIVAIFFLVLAMALTSPVQAQSNFDFNYGVKNQLIPLSNIRSAIVVNIRTYLSLRERPSVYSRELARIQNGTMLTVNTMVPAPPSDWALTWYNGIEGYVNWAYIRVVN